MPLFEQETTLAEISRSLRTLQQEIQIGEQQLHQLQEQEQRSRLQIQQMQADGTLDSLYQQASQQRAVIEVNGWLYVAEVKSIVGYCDRIIGQQLPELLKSKQPVISRLTNNAHSRLDFSEGLVTVDELSLYNLSTGTKDQVMMAFSFCVSNLAAKASALCPVIIDDGWLHYDHRRKYQFAKLLRHFSEKYQVILFVIWPEMVSYYQSFTNQIWGIEGVNDEKSKN